MKAPISSRNIAISLVNTEELDLRFLHSKEIALSQRFKHSKRQESFLLGRMAAHLALRSMDAQIKSAIGISKSGAALWPKGYTGSISHCKDLAIAGIAKTSHFVALGLDVEEVSRFKNLSIAKKICTEDELIWVNSEKKKSTYRLALIFSAKEALYKALNPLLKKYIGFKQAEVLFLKDATIKIKLASEIKLNEKFKLKGETRIFEDHAIAIVSVSKKRPST